MVDEHHQWSEMKSRTEAWSSSKPGKGQSGALLPVNSRELNMYVRKEVKFPNKIIVMMGGDYRSSVRKDHDWTTRWPHLVRLRLRYM